MAASSLAALPDARRVYLLSRFGRLGYEGVDKMVRRRSQRPCRLPPAIGLAERVAVLGDDGRYHLQVDGQLSCAKARSSGAWLHVDYCQVPDASSGRNRLTGHGPKWLENRLMVTWLVTMTGSQVEPELVGRCQRCPVTPVDAWPPVRDASPKGRIRAALIDHAGASCHACWGQLGMVIDHDSRTGLVRGLLCNTCNWSVDLCPHPTGCPWADYLTEPPGAVLGLLYPGGRYAQSYRSR